MEELTTKLLGSLNEKQREAVVSESKRILVLAGAGSGKTKTLLQKLNYLIEEKAVKPSNLLAITFTKNAANEMLDRLILNADHTGEYARILSDKTKTSKEINFERYQWTKKFKWINNLSLSTFHSLCYKILREFGVNEYDNKFRIIGDSEIKDPEYSKYSATETTFEILHKILIEKCESDEFLLNFKRYLLDFLVDKIHLQNEKEINWHNDGKFYTSLNGTKVRSKSEQYIADWFYRHRIEFEYEPLVNFKDFDFKPDFYIPAANLYLEHISNLSYPTKTKEEQFRISNKLLVKTFEAQTKDTTTFNLCLENIIKERLPEKSQTHSLSFDEEFKSYHGEIKDFLKQTLRLIDMLKVENLPLEEILKKSQTDQHERVRNFYNLAIPLIKNYNFYCTNRSYLDFNDIIIRTIELFKNRPEIANKYSQQFKYILVDEFQDVNNLQVELINLLLNETNQLFCVGDDWQSIYGFRGSNVDYIVNFKSHFKDASLIKLNLNYRSSGNIVGASNEVIKKNSVRVDKLVKAVKRSNNKIRIYGGNDEKQNIEFVINQVKKLQKEKGYSKEEILVLYRRNKMFIPFSKRFKEEGIQVSGKTIHGSKGLEAKAVFIIGLTDGPGGFPDIWMEDRIYQVVKESLHDVLLEEERRLFYVALTRAEEYLFLITEKGYESRFLKEIPEIFTSKTSSINKPLIEDVVLCNKCEKALEEDFRFCPFCGTEKRDQNFELTLAAVADPEGEVIDEKDIAEAIKIFQDCEYSPTYSRLSHFFLKSKSFNYTEINSHSLYGRYKNSFSKKELHKLLKTYLIDNCFTLHGKVKKDRRNYSWRNIEFFDEETFNNLSDSNIKQLKEKISELGIKKSEDLPENVVLARINYPRAYEPWIEKEEELLRKAMTYTNNIDLLTECFLRGKGSIESKGKRIKYQIEKNKTELKEF
jgi:DNA helicase-4